MIIQDTKWDISEPIPEDVAKNLTEFSPIFQQVLYNRNIKNSQEANFFLNASPPDHETMELMGTRKAVERIGQALHNHERIAIYGDYDADGVTATALMLQTMRALKADVRAYIPNRFTEGYGLNTNALDKLKKDGVDLVITVDCGIRAVEDAEHAYEIGLELIVTDHHTTGTHLPRTAALINPKQPDDPYPEKVLAGVGVAYKLAKALIEAFQPEELTADDLLDLVAIGTVADLVPLVGENRMLVRKGLEYLKTPQRQGLASLMGVSGITAAKISASDIGFRIGPRINAAGRIGDAQDALRLLTTQDIFEAGQYAQVLDNRNRERQRITQEIQDLAESISGAHDPNSMLLFAHHPEFNPGVVGLAASRLVDQYYRPAVVGFRNEEFTRASCRSIPEFHITHALEKCSDLLTQFGGHAAAAGFTVPNKNLAELTIRLQELASEELTDQDLQPSLKADAEVELVELRPVLIKELNWLQPTGQQNPDPVFISRKVSVRGARAVGKDSSHLKLILSDGKITFDAIAFRFGHLVSEIPGMIDIMYAFELNDFNGRQTLQLNIKDLKFAW
ncbi:MAG TPA: single-stranded-DNA-specific exonuclease RecJ [Anaerolineales bacterium]|jgi:single-stranded-DNA-specific exonuclease|nr:single-stranded-DNA-specific exonuclease RecJ [Anaerolineales bacterium]